jgi:hypothetical protein
MGRIVEVGKENDASSISFFSVRLVRGFKTELNPLGLTGLKKIFFFADL